MEFPAELKYTSDHEWLRAEGHEATVGITAFAARELGDIIYLDLQAAGTYLEAGDVFGTVEAVKTVSDLIMPVSGFVIEINRLATENPEMLNSDPYGVSGWLIRIRPDDPVAQEDLLSSAVYLSRIAHD